MADNKPNSSEYKIGRHKIKLKIALTIILSMLILALIINPARYIQSVYAGLLLFANSVLPSLFPFFFFSKALTAIGTATMLANSFRKPIRLLYNAPPTASYIMIMSMLSGYPIGACLISNYYEQGLITSQEASKIATFTSTSGPLFIIGTVASGFLNNTVYGYIILAAHYLGSMINGIIYRGKRNPNASPDTKIKDNSIDITLSDIATSSIANILLVGAYIAIFSMVIDFLIDIKVIAALSNALNLIGCPREIANGAIISLVEVTRGLFILSQSNINIRILLPLICSLISFGGLSITMQSITFLSKCKIAASRYLLTKFTQAAISFIICYLFTLML